MDFDDPKYVKIIIVCDNYYKRYVLGHKVWEVLLGINQVGKSVTPVIFDLYILQYFILVIY